MIDFKNSDVLQLSPIDQSKMLPAVDRFLIEGEDVFQAFKTFRDQLVFTNKRIVSANVKGLTGKKVD